MALPKNRMTIVKDRNTGEWVVKVYENGKLNEDKTYYTDDREDAENTKRAMQNSLAGLAAVIPDGLKTPLALGAAAAAGAYLMHLWMKKQEQQNRRPAPILP
jgi:hypothetical protein